MLFYICGLEGSDEGERLLARKLEIQANKGRSFEKPDEAIKVVTTASEPDNTSDLLAIFRYSLSPEIVEPSVYCVARGTPVPPSCLVWKKTRG